LCDEAISLEELASLLFHVCLGVDVRKDVEAAMRLARVVLKCASAIAATRETEGLLYYL
jgi:hypothetical protein